MNIYTMHTSRDYSRHRDDMAKTKTTANGSAASVYKLFD
jgi:hypothetical protein